MTRAKIVERRRGAIEVVRLRLDTPDAFLHQPGQYTAVVAEDGSQIPFSIASAPHRLPELELHFQPQAGLPEAETMSALLSGTHLELAAPEGEATLVEEKPIALICGGSGIAQAWSMLEHLEQQASARSVIVSWAVDDISQLYLGERLAQLNVPMSLHVFVDAKRTADNRSLTWLRDQAAALQQRTVFLCGGPPFVYACEDVLRATNAEPFDLRSDVFSYAPRQPG